MQSIRRIMVTGGCTLTRDSQRLIGQNLLAQPGAHACAAQRRSLQRVIVPPLLIDPLLNSKLQQLRAEIDSSRLDGSTFTKQLYNTYIYIYIYIYIARTADSVSLTRNFVTSQAFVFQLSRNYFPRFIFGRGNSAEYVAHRRRLLFIANAARNPSRG